MDTKQIAAAVRNELKSALPGWKFSVTMKSYAGGSSITVALMEGPEQVVEGKREHIDGWGCAVHTPYTKAHPFPGYAQLNHYQLLGAWSNSTDKYLSNGEYLTPKGWSVMKAAASIVEKYHWDKSEPQTDYFCCNFYYDIHIGKWNQNFQVKG